MFFIEHFKRYLKEINNPIYKFLKLFNYNESKPILNLKNHIKENNDKFIENIKNDFNSLDKDLIKIRSSNMRYAVHINYNNEYKIYSKNSLIKNFRIHESVNSVSKYAISKLNEKNISNGDIIKMWEKCIETDLFPKIVDQKNDYITVEYINKNFKTLYDIYNEKNIYFVSSIIKKNKEKIHSYYNKIKNQSLCINDFNLNNFVVDNNNEMFMIDLGDIDYTILFLPEIFFLDDINGKLVIFIFSSIGKKDKKFYKDFIYEYYDKNEISKIYFM